MRLLPALVYVQYMFYRLWDDEEEGDVFASETDAQSVFFAVLSNTSCNVTTAIAFRTIYIVVGVGLISRPLPCNAERMDILLN